jgi:beta-lactamase class A
MRDGIRTMSRRPIWLIAAMLVGCVAPSAPPPRPQAAPAPIPSAPVQPAIPAASRPPAGLEASIVALGRGFPGQVGIAVRDVSTGWSIGYNDEQPMPQQSVSKLWVAMTVLDAVDRGALNLSQPVVVRQENLTLFHQPVRAMMGKDGFATTYGELLRIALTRSDNTCNDMLLWWAGGPDAVRAMIARKELGRIAFGPGERLLQSRIAGIQWRPEYRGGAGFMKARAALSYDKRKAALDAYLADPMDGATADAIAGALARLAQGDLLSPASTRLLLGTMRSSVTGPQRLHAGLGPGWTLAHKTGTGQQLGALATGYNDTGLITAPDGHSYAVAVMIGSTREPIPVRQKLMSDVVRAVVSAHNWTAGQPVRASR